MNNSSLGSASLLSPEEESSRIVPLHVNLNNLSFMPVYNHIGSLFVISNDSDIDDHHIRSLPEDINNIRRSIYFRYRSRNFHMHTRAV